MEFLRVFVRLPLIIVTTLLCYMLLMAGKMLSLVIRDKKHRPVRFFLGIWGRSMCFLVGMKLEVVGKAPEVPFFFVSNHLSYVDVFILAAAIKSHFIIKSEVKTWPVFGFLVNSMGMLFVDREKRTDVARVNSEISGRLRHNYGIAMFPESTTSPGYTILPFKSSLLAYPEDYQYPVYYGAISYAVMEGTGHACDTVVWWDDTPFFAHFVRLLKSKSFAGKLNIAPVPLVGGNRKILAENLHEAALKMFTPVISEKEFGSRYGEQSAAVSG